MFKRVFFFFQPSNSKSTFFSQIVDTADQAAVEVTVVTPVMMKGEEVGKIKSK